LNESFNGKFRDECLSMEWFKNRLDAKIVIEAWRQHYNEVRPHSSLGQLTPLEFKQQLSQQSPNQLFSRIRWSEESRQVIDAGFQADRIRLDVSRRSGIKVSEVVVKPRLTLSLNATP
jgi:hypothetical protein